MLMLVLVRHPSVLTIVLSLPYLFSYLPFALAFHVPRAAFYSCKIASRKFWNKFWNISNSDHSSWKRAGYRSAFAMETEFHSSNPNIHTSRDDIDNVDFTSQNSLSLTRFSQSELFTEYSDSVDLIPESSSTIGVVEMEAKRPPLSEEKYLIVTKDSITQARVDNILMVLFCLASHLT